MKEPTTFAKCLAAHMLAAEPDRSALPTPPKLHRGLFSAVIIMAASAIGGMAVALWLLQGAPR